MSLAVNVNRLTREHLTTGLDGKPAKIPALLDQLDHAVTEQTTRGGAGSGGAAIPIGTGALSLRQDIDRATREHQREMNRPTDYPVAGILQSWVTIEGEWADYLEHVTLDWCDQVAAIVNPTKPPRRLHQPCPACGVMYGGDDMRPGLQVHCWDNDGGMMAPGEWTAECIHCGAAWDNNDMAWLTRAINVASRG